MSYGVWGLVDLIHASKRIGEKISPELELQIIEERLKNPALSPTRIMETVAKPSQIPNNCTRKDTK